MIGTANNQAVRDLLNEECYPQLFANTGAPIWGDVENYPWTTGGLPPYNTETAIYVEDIAREFPDGATAAVFHVNSEFGDAYQAAFSELAADAGIEIVDEQTIENADSNPPTSQVNAIAAEEPDVDPRGAAGRAVPGVPVGDGQRQGGQPRLGAAHLHHEHVRQHPAPLASPARRPMGSTPSSRRRTPTTPPTPRIRPSPTTARR